MLIIGKNRFLTFVCSASGSLVVRSRTNSVPSPSRNVGIRHRKYICQSDKCTEVECPVGCEEYHLFYMR